MLSHENPGQWKTKIYLCEGIFSTLKVKQGERDWNRLCNVGFTRMVILSHKIRGRVQIVRINSAILYVLRREKMNEMEQIPEGWNRVDPRDDCLENAVDRLGVWRHRHCLRHDHRHHVRWERLNIIFQFYHS